MLNDNIVVFKGRKDGITIILDEKIDFEQLKITFDKKVKDAKKFFKDAKTSISFQGRELSEAEEIELLNILSTNSDLSISYISESATNAKKSISAEKMNTETVKLPKSRRKQPGLECYAYYHSGSLRSGQSIRYKGSVVVVGDVNPGAEIVAEGNIIVLGAANGLIYAGCDGSQDKFVFAMKLTPIQLRIADVITIVPKETKKSKNPVRPSYAYLKEGTLYIEIM